MPAGQEVTLFTASGPDGPFTPAVIDSDGIGPVVLAWDLPRQRPFAVYRAEVEGEDYGEYRAAYRDNGGAWQRQFLGRPQTFAALQVSLALDPLGAPGAAWTQVDPVLATASRGGAVHGGIEDGRVHVSTQRALAPSSAWDDVVLSYANDGAPSARAVGSHFAGTFDVCWREPRLNQPPFTLLYTEVGNGMTGVPGIGTAPESRLTLGPNPAVSGGAIAIRWAQAWEAEAEFTLFDLAGRAVLTRSAGARPPGGQEFALTLPSVGTGLYWLALSLDGVRQESRKVIVR